MTNSQERFEIRLNILNSSDVTKHWCAPLVDVLDTAGTVAAWLDDRGLEQDPMAIAKLTELVLQRDTKLLEAENKS
jgi:hypothetical protein